MFLSLQTLARYVLFRTTPTVFVTFYISFPAGALANYVIFLSSSDNFVTNTSFPAGSCTLRHIFNSFGTVVTLYISFPAGPSTLRHRLQLL